MLLRGCYLKLLANDQHKRVTFGQNPMIALLL